MSRISRYAMHSQAKLEVVGVGGPLFFTRGRSLFCVSLFSPSVTILIIFVSYFDLWGITTQPPLIIRFPSTPRLRRYTRSLQYSVGGVPKSTDNELLLQTSCLCILHASLFTFSPCFRLHAQPWYYWLRYARTRSLPFFACDRPSHQYTVRTPPDFPFPQRATRPALPPSLSRECDAGTEVPEAATTSYRHRLNFLSLTATHCLKTAFVSLRF